MYKYIIVSDLHLGTKHSKAKEFLQFIEENPCEQLILNGDIIDGWALQRGTKWRTSHTKVIAKLIKLSTKQKIVNQQKQLGFSLDLKWESLNITLKLYISIM